MKHRLLRYTDGWEWHMLTSGRADELPVTSGLQAAPDDAGEPDIGAGDVSAPSVTSLLDVKRLLPACADWLDACLDRNEAQVTVTELPGGEEALHGTLMVRLSEDRHDVIPFHYWLTAGRLVTLLRDLRFALRLQRSPWEDKLQRAASAPEAFAVMLSAALEPFHDGLDAFERRIGELDEALDNPGQAAFTEAIFRRRYELLHWRHSFVGIKEAEGALAEAFPEKLRDSESCRKLALRLARIEHVIGHYTGEIEALIAMDEVMTTRRGNDSLKTLTTVTALFAPATAAGAIWSMNFEVLPWSEESWGFAALVGIVFAATAVILLLIKRKQRNDDSASAGSGRARKPKVRRKGRYARSGNMGLADSARLAAQHKSADADRQGSGLPSRSARR